MLDRFPQCLPQCCLEILDEGIFRRKRRIRDSLALFRTGSSAELAGCQGCLKGFCNTKENRTDHDLMFLSSEWLALPWFYPTPAGYSGGIVRIMSVGVRSGYTNLVRDCCSNNLRHEHVAVHAAESLFKHGPAEETEIALRELYYCCKNHFKECTKPHDIVGAVHCPYWPSKAKDWMTERRERALREESKLKLEVLKLCERYGCDFVCVAYKNRDHDDEFRFSFSVAERIIIQSWSTNQRAVYRAMRVLHKIASQEIEKFLLKSHLRSYYFKTLMLRAVDEKPSSFWDESFLTDSVQILLEEMIKCLKNKKCQHYFIPKCNVMAKIKSLDDIELAVHINQLTDLVQSPKTLKRVLECCIEEEKNKFKANQESREELIESLDEFDSDLHKN